jgi:hypothetical protein
MLLKFSSASWTRPRYLRHRPFNSFTKHSSSTEYSFSENRGVREEGRLAHFCISYSGIPYSAEPRTQVNQTWSLSLELTTEKDSRY